MNYKVLNEIRSKPDFGVFDTVEICNSIDSLCEKTKGFLVYCKITGTDNCSIYDRVILAFKDSPHVSYMGSDIQVLSCKMVLTEKYDILKEYVFRNSMHL